MTRILFRSLAIAVIGVTFCQAQVTPVVAKRRLIKDVIDGQGNVISHEETVGIYLRNSLGSTLTKNYPSEGGKSTAHSGQLVDYSRYKLYDLSYERSEAMEKAVLHDGPHPEYLANTSTSLGEETVSGLRCLIHSVYTRVNGEKRRIGKTYDSAEYGLRIKEDAILEPPHGPRTHLVEELYDVQFVEPDPREFALKGFSFLEKSPSVPSPDPTAIEPPR